MSRVTRASVVLWLAAAAGPLGAQGGTSARIREQERLVDSLVAVQTRAFAALRAYDDSASRARIRKDTLQVGNFRLLVEPPFRERAERAAKVASARVDSIARTAAQRLAATWIVVRGTGGSSLDTVVISFLQRQAAYPDQRVMREFQNLWGVPSDSTLAQWLYATAMRALTESIDASTLAWQGGYVLPDTVTTFEWIGTRLDLVSSPTTVAHRCYDGDVAACRVALRLVPLTDRVTEWFDSAGRRSFVADYSRGNSTRDPDVELCAEGSDAACIAYMRGVRAYNDPVFAHRRATVAKTAIRMGGVAGFERYVTASGSQADRLAAAAGAPLDSVLRVWVNSVREVRQPSRDISTGIGLSSLGWVLLCGMLALRSSRWR